MSDTRSFPDVEFCHKTADEILDELVSSWESTMGRSLGKADPIRAMLAWEASIDAQLYAAINESARMNMPRYAAGEYLDSLAEIFYWGLQRLPASAATTILRFTLSEPATSTVAIPVGTECTGDGKAMFSTNETVYIYEGKNSADVKATCTETGTLGNGFSVGSINKCTTPDNVEGLDSVENLTVTEGGSAEEDDESFYQRMRESMSAYSTAGSRQSYIYYAKSTNANVGDVHVESPSPGSVDVYIMRTDGELPDDELIEAVQQALSADEVRPLTDLVTVKKPTPVSFDIKVTWYRDLDDTESYETIESELERATTEYLEWQTTKMGRDINPSMMLKILMGSGAKRIVVEAPEFETVEENQVAQVGEITLTFGGNENG